MLKDLVRHQYYPHDNSIKCFHFLYIDYISVYLLNLDLKPNESKHKLSPFVHLWFICC